MADKRIGELPRAESVGSDTKIPVENKGAAQHVTGDQFVEFAREAANEAVQALKTDETLVLKDGVLSVNTADVVEAGNTLPITSAAVHVTVGNIEALLETI